MTRFPLFPSALAALALLAGCAALQPAAAPPPPAAEAAPRSAAPPPRPAARTVEEFDTTSAAARAAAVAPPAAAERELGRTVASLGNPAEPGFWLRTPLVRQAGKGRIVHPGTGASVQVDLIPLAGEAGAGSQVSLSALRLLGVPLTALPEIVVYGS